MSSSMRAWQAECVAKAIAHYRHSSHFFCQATPGSGKTRMAAEIARQLLLDDKVDLVLCFAPSCQVVDGLRITFANVLGRRLDGLIGAVGSASTYQGMDHRDERFWALLDQYRVLTVFDEIHHCAGHDSLLSNAWGQSILQRIQDRAEFTLALSGTPWRSDEKPIALARYSNPEGRLICDYRYGLQEAIADGVCRSPRIVLLDNSSVKLTEHSDNDTQVTVYPSIAELLTDSPITFEDLLTHDEIINQVIELGCRKLDEIRGAIPNAGGLLVATNIHHANQIAAVLMRFGETFEVVTNRMPNAQIIIDDFRNGACRWIVAVGLISEGTDIPRLQVCCYLSRIRTELHYRQVLGRVLRRIGVGDDQAWLYVLAEPTLQQFSERVAKDLPEELAVIKYIPPIRTDINITDDGIGQNDEKCPIEMPSGHHSPRPTEDERFSLGLMQEEQLYTLEMSSNFRTEILAIY